MPNFSAHFGGYNVEGSVNLSIIQNLTANGLPAWMPSARVITELGREGLVLSGYSGHAFALSHLGSTVLERYEGGQADNGTGGYSRQGMIQIDCWISKTNAGEGFPSRLRMMRDMVSRSVGSGRAAQILDAYASTATPVYASAIVRIQPVEFDAPTIDTNPDFARIRGVARYQWVERNG